MRRRLLGDSGGGGLSPSESSALDICLYDKDRDKLIIVKNDQWSIKSYPKNNYDPIGIVVIPGNHNIYEDESCAVISLKEMSYNSPDDGVLDSNSTMYFGNNEKDIQDLANYNEIACIGGGGNVGDGTIIYSNTTAYLPSDKFNAKHNTHDSDTYYSIADSGYYAPSPFNDNDTRNPEYYRTSSPSSQVNTLSDFNGKENAKILTDLAIEQSDWKTNIKITNSYSGNYYSAACCCWRYYTNGTKQGDWYLPAMGELGYIVIKLGRLNNTITTLLNSYGNHHGIILDEKNIGYLSSTEYGYNFNGWNLVRGLELKNGFACTFRKDYGYRVRAFLRVK